MGILCVISLNCDYHRDALIILSKTILIRHLGTISDPYTTSDHQIYSLIISLHLKIDCVSVYGHFVYDITKLRLLQESVIIMSKTILIRHLGTISDPYTPLDHPINLLIISLHLLIDWLASMGIWCMISLNCNYHRDALIILSKTILILHLGAISDPSTPLDHPIYLLTISLHLKIDWLASMGIWCMISLNCDYYRDPLIIMSKTISIRHLGSISHPHTPLDHPFY